MSKNSIAIHTGDELFGDDVVVSDEFYSEIKDILDRARSTVYRTANSAMVRAYWRIGESIVARQGGKEHAEYGKRLIKGLSQRLSADYGKGFTPTNLRYMRQFYLLFPNYHALRDELSWTHYRLLLKVEDARARNFYLTECIEAGWSTRQLERQINSFFYQRLNLSRDTDAVRNEICKSVPAGEPKDFVRDPYVLEFLGIESAPSLYEKNLEAALIGNLQSFLLELGRGFSFVARQKHFDMDGEHYYVDLVFYNYVLKCFVLIDLKTTRLTHQDVGQMDMYVRVFDEQIRATDDNPTIGIILCAEKSKAVAKYSILNDSLQLFASKYELTLPTPDELEAYILEERQRIETESECAD